jgi:arsenate reductase (thioredoxin)
MKARVLVLCTGNSCRSQMAEAFLRKLDSSLEVFSAGTQPAQQVHPLAIQVMKEVGIDLTQAKPKNIDQFIAQPFDIVLTVCDNARESCPVFTGKVKQRHHLGFEDPAVAKGSERQILDKFREVRDEIREGMHYLYGEHINHGKR